MTKEESAAWVASLKPGDEVIYKDMGIYVYVARVKKVTPSGIVRTTHGSFKESQWSISGYVGGYGGISGHIEPLTEKLLEEAKIQEAERAERKKKEDTISMAKSMIRKLYDRRYYIEYDEAQKIIKALKEIEGEPAKEGESKQ